MTNPEQITRNANDIKSTVVGLITSKKIENALSFFDDHTDEVVKAYNEYRPEKHSIMSRPDKVRRSRSDYQTNKLPRNWQNYINEVELYFLMNNGITWEMLNDNSEQSELQDVFRKFQDLLKELHYDTYAREAKRLAGAETECAKLYALYKDEGEAKLRIIVLSYSKGYKLRPLFNRYGDLKMFAVGYTTKLADGNIQECWDMYASEVIYHCKKLIGTEHSGEWEVTPEMNPFGKIPIIYVKQPKAWDGVQERIERDEWLDSKNADCNEYFSDPILKISRQVKNGLMDPKSTGKVIQINNKDDVVEYVTPPDATDLKTNEKSVIKESILMGSMTPDLSNENIKGLGAISGDAQTENRILGYIKRLSRMEIYDELFQREASLIKAIMANYLYLEDRVKINKMKLGHIYQDPTIGVRDNSEEIQRWAEIGMSDEAIVEANRNIHNKKLELSRLQEKRERELAISIGQYPKIDDQTNKEE